MSAEQLDYLGRLLGEGLSWSLARFVQRYPDAGTPALEGALVLIDVVYDQMIAGGKTANEAVEDLVRANARLGLEEIGAERLESIRGLFSHEDVRRARLRDLSIQQAMPVLDSLQLYCDLRLIDSAVAPPMFALVLVARIEADEALGGVPSAVVNLQITEEKLELLQAQFSDMAAKVAAVRAAMGPQLL